jgi:hypothetical protein
VALPAERAAGGRFSAERMPGGVAGQRARFHSSLQSGRDSTRARGRAAARPAGRAGRTDPAAHFQITSSEIANTCSQHRKRRLSIHLRASYLNVISSCRRMAGIFVLRPSHGCQAQLGAQLARAATDCTSFLQVRRLETRVPPVGVEPTLGTLLGGRPLPLGYGGWIRIPRPRQIIRGRPMGWRKIP